METIYNTLVNGATSCCDIKSNISKFNEAHENDENDNIPKLGFKEDDDLMIVYSEVNSRTGNELDDGIKSLIIDKKTLKQIVTQYNKPIFNDDAKDFMNDKNWENTKVKYCNEGTLMIVFYHANKWYVCTRKCLDASKSFWVKNISYHELFLEAIKDKFTFDDLKKSFCYHFVLIHHKNKNIVRYPNLHGKYATVELVRTTIKYTDNTIDCTINDKILYPKTVTINNYEQLSDYIMNISRNDENYGYITTEGFIVEHYCDNKMTILKFQTPIYKKIWENKPNVNNIDAVLLELYQTDKLREFGSFFAENPADYVVRIKNALKVLSEEVLNIYHLTRSRKNQDLYELLPPSYKIAIYKIHGLYLKTANNVDENSDKISFKKSITVHEVYDCLKHLNGFTLRTMFIDRIELIETHAFDKYCVINKNLSSCEMFDALVQGKLLQ